MTNKGSWTSLIIGLPTGVFTILIVFLGGLALVGLLTQEGLPGIGLFYMYKTPVIVMTIVFTLLLWPTGRLIESEIIKERKLLLISFKYSAIINSILFIVILIVTSLDGLDLFFGLILPLILFIPSTIISTFTVGLLITNTIKRRITRT